VSIGRAESFQSLEAPRNDDPVEEPSDDAEEIVEVTNFVVPAPWEDRFDGKKAPSAEAAPEGLEVDSASSESETEYPKVCKNPKHFDDDEIHLCVGDYFGIQHNPGFEWWVVEIADFERNKIVYNNLFGAPGYITVDEMFAVGPTRCGKFDTTKKRIKTDCNPEHIYVKRWPSMTKAIRETHYFPMSEDECKRPRDKADRDLLWRRLVTLPRDVKVDEGEGNEAKKKKGKENEGKKWRNKASVKPEWLIAGTPNIWPASARCEPTICPLCNKWIADPKVKAAEFLQLAIRWDKIGVKRAGYGVNKYLKDKLSAHCQAEHGHQNFWFALPPLVEKRIAPDDGIGRLSFRSYVQTLLTKAHEDNPIKWTDVKVPGGAGLKLGIIVKVARALAEHARLGITRYGTDVTISEYRDKAAAYLELMYRPISSFPYHEWMMPDMFSPSMTQFQVFNLLRCFVLEGLLWSKPFPPLVNVPAMPVLDDLKMKPKQVAANEKRKGNQVVAKEKGRAKAKQTKISESHNAATDVTLSEEVLRTEQV
jgi:hypothetical protein